MTREEWVENYTRSLGAFMYGPPNKTAEVITEIIGSIYDLQQQIAQKDEFIDYLDNRLISLEQEVYK